MRVAAMALLPLTPIPLSFAVRARALAVSAAAPLTSRPSSLPPARPPHVNPRVLLGMLESELQQLATEFGQQKYRGKQLHHLPYKTKVKDIQAFSHLPQAFRDDLREAGWMVGRSPVHHTVTAADVTVKILLRLSDNRLVETVGIPIEEERVLAVSLLVCRRSLHAPNQKLWDTIIPSAKSYPLDAIMEDGRNYFLETSRCMSFEYTLLAGVNDSIEHAVELAELMHAWGRGNHVNLMPFNPIEGSEYRRPYKKQVLAFATSLESRKITVSIRQIRGLDASAACGQLKNEYQKFLLPVEVES